VRRRDNEPSKTRKKEMVVKPFIVPQYNQHYEGGYTDRGIEWRRLCAIDKVSNIKALLTEKVQSVLEVGCGTGAVLAELGRRGVGTNHEGVDLAAPDAHVDPGATHLSLKEYDGEKLPCPANHFDLVYASHVVEHVPHPRLFLSEIARVTKRLVYLEVPCELHLRTRHSDIQNTLKIGHINSFSPESFALLCQTAGLKVLDIRLFDHSLGVHAFHTSRVRGVVKMKMRRSLLSMNPILASRLFTYHCGALCESQ
jgi:SAM-dependent methyltransferase